MTTIYLNRDNAEQVQAVPLWWHDKGLQYTATGYGSKIPTRYKAFVRGKFRRVYCRIFSNIGTCFVMVGKEKTNCRV